MNMFFQYIHTHSYMGCKDGDGLCSTDLLLNHSGNNLPCVKTLSGLCMRDKTPYKMPSHTHASKVQQYNYCPSPLYRQGEFKSG